MRVVELEDCLDEGGDMVTDVCGKHVAECIEGRWGRADGRDADATARPDDAVHLAERAALVGEELESERAQRDVEAVVVERQALGVR